MNPKTILKGLVCLPLLIFSQTRSISFETGSVAEAFEKAKREKKHVFVDGYTTWCGPCKMMTKNTFTNDSVADYFNARFVNLKLDMEKGEGPAFAEKYEVNCYPNLLILDADGKLVHRAAGYLKPTEFLAYARKGLSKSNFFAEREAMEKNLNEKNISQYLQLLSNACLQSSQAVLDYLGRLEESDLSKPVNFQVFEDFVKSADSREAQYFLRNIQEFEKKVGRERAEEKAVQLGLNWMSSFISNENYSPENFENVKNEFRHLKWPYADRVIFEAELNALKKRDKAAYYAQAAQHFLKYYNNRASKLNSMAWKFYEEVSDPGQLKAATLMAKRASELEGHYANLDTYAALLFKTGNYREADAIATKALAKAKAQKLKPDEYKETEDLQKKIRAKLK